MTRFSDITVAIQEWVIVRLNTQAMADALGVTLAKVPARIWDSPPPPSVTGFYVDLTVAEPRDQGGIGFTEVMATAEVTVKVVGRAEAYEPLRPIAAVIHDRLHGRKDDPVSGGGVILSSRRVRSIAYPETTQGVEYRHLGGTYQVSAQ